MSTRIRKKRKDSKWRPIMAVQMYRMVRLGLSEKAVCEELKISRQALFLWKKNREEVREALKLAEQDLQESSSLKNWVYAKLSPSLRKVWDEITLLENQDDGYTKLQLLLEDQGVKVKQQLFLYSLCEGGFSMSKALSKIGVSKGELDKWINQDLDFAELVGEIQWHKGNFFEESLVKLVKEGNASAAIFANRTFNKERGYAKSDELNVNLNGKVVYGVLDLDKLLPFMKDDLKAELMEAIRKSNVDEKADKPRLSYKEKVLEEIRGEKVV